MSGDGPGTAPPVARTVALRVIAQDPSVKAGRRILTTLVDVPAEHLDPGPRGARFHVVDYDSEKNRLETPARLPEGDGDPFRKLSDSELTSDPVFRAHNVYAIAARTLATFEAALGRRVPWEFDGEQLYLVPRAIPERNAFYAFEDMAIYFGYDGDVQTALSHDIVAHETTHAVLDGLRPRFVEPGLPDQPAFHEALGDIVALLSVFSLEPVVARLLDPDEEGRVARAALKPRRLEDSPLFRLAEQLGRGQGSRRGSALRRSVKLPADDSWMTDPEYEEPHRRGEVLVAAVMRTMLDIWTERLPALGDRKGADAARVAEEGAAAARHLLTMVIRGIDYMPPVELEFDDIVEAIYLADQVVAPDAPAYRDALGKQFAKFGIQSQGRIADLSRDLKEPLVYERVNYVALRSDHNEVARFLWDNADALGVDRRWHTEIGSVRPSARVGPDGLIVNEVVTEYRQTLDLTAAELVAEAKRGHFRFRLPPRVDPGTKIQLWGGGVVIFDQFGRARFHGSKPLAAWDRQQRRLDYLAGHGLFDTRERLGFTLSAPRGQRFAALHVSDDHAEEDW